MTRKWVLNVEKTCLWHTIAYTSIYAYKLGIYERKSVYEYYLCVYSRAKSYGGSQLSMAIAKASADYRYGYRGGREPINLMWIWWMMTKLLLSLLRLLFSPSPSSSSSSSGYRALIAFFRAFFLSFFLSLSRSSSNVWKEEESKLFFPLSLSAPLLLKNFLKD